MAVASIFAPTQLHYSVSILAGLLLALADFGASAAFAALTPRRQPALGAGLMLAGLLVRLTFVFAALVALVRFLHLLPVPLGAGLAGGFTVLTLIAAALTWRKNSPRTARTRLSANETT